MDLRQAAQSAVALAVSRGEIPLAKALTCADCSLEASDYHHESYAEEDQLKVVPLCRKCHTRRHHPLPSEPLTQVTVRMPWSLYRAMCHYCADKRLSRKTFVNDAVRKELRRLRRIDA